MGQACAEVLFAYEPCERRNPDHRLNQDSAQEGTAIERKGTGANMHRPGSKRYEARAGRECAQKGCTAEETWRGTELQGHCRKRVVLGAGCRFSVASGVPDPPKNSRSSRQIPAGPGINMFEQLSG